MLWEYDFFGCFLCLRGGVIFFFGRFVELIYSSRLIIVLIYKLYSVIIVMMRGGKV